MDGWMNAAISDTQSTTCMCLYIGHARAVVMSCICLLFRVVSRTWYSHDHMLIAPPSPPPPPPPVAPRVVPPPFVYAPPAAPLPPSPIPLPPLYWRDPELYDEYEREMRAEQVSTQSTQHNYSTGTGRAGAGAGAGARAWTGLDRRRGIGNRQRHPWPYEALMLCVCVCVSDLYLTQSELSEGWLETAATCCEARSTGCCYQSCC